MIAAIGNCAGIVAPGSLDLLALPERKKDEPGQNQSDCDSEPLVQCHGTTPLLAGDGETRSAAF
jgi:hypothetical protein